MKRPRRSWPTADLGAKVTDASKDQTRCRSLRVKLERLHLLCANPGQHGVRATALCGSRLSLEQCVRSIRTHQRPRLSVSRLQGSHEQPGNRKEKRMDL